MKHLVVTLVMALLALGAPLSTAAQQLPFVPTTIDNGRFADNTHWYSIQVRASKYLYVNTENYVANGSCSLICRALNGVSSSDEAYLWTFVDAGNGAYRIYNYALGTAACLGANSLANHEYPSFTPQSQKFDTYTVFPSQNTATNGFVIKPVGAEGLYLNDISSSNVIGFWENSNALTSAGSCMVIAEVEVSGNGGGGTVVPQPDPALVENFSALIQTAQQAYDANCSYEPEALMRTPSQFYSPFSQNDLGQLRDGGDFDALIDKNTATFWHTYWQGGDVEPGVHYLRCTAPEDLGRFDGEYTVSITRRNSTNDHPTQFVVYGSNNPNDGNSWTTIGTLLFDYKGQGSTSTASLHVDAPYKYLRFNCSATTGNRGYFHMAEFQIYGDPIISPSCPNGLYPEAAATFVDAIAQAQAILDAYKAGNGTITQSDVTALQQAINAYRRAIVILVSSLSISPTEFMTFDVGAKQTLKSTILPADASNTALKWTTSNAAVATVSNNGVITAIGGGQCTITATTTDGTNLSAYCRVSVYTDYDYSALCINEIQTANIDQYLDPSFNYGGWIELYNPSDTPIPLKGLYVVGSNHNGVEEAPFRFLFPLDSRYDYGYVPAHGFKNVWFDHYAIYNNKPITEHEAYKQVFWKLDPDGGHVALLDRDGQSVLCSLDYPAMPPRASYARTTDGGNIWAWHASGTPASSNNNARDYLSAPLRLKAPVVDVESQVNGSVTNFSVVIPDGATLRYTTNGATPTALSAENRDGHFNVGVYGTETYRLRLFKDGYLPSPVVTRSFINGTKGKHVPIIAVTTSDGNLHNSSYGVFTTNSPNGRPGQGASGKSNRNMDWERPINVEYFDFANGDNQYVSVLNQEADFAVAGGWSRNSGSVPPFKIKAAEQYEGVKYLHYPVFRDKPYNKNRTLLLRHEADLLDVGIQEIARRSGLNLDTQAWEPAELFINGTSRGYVPIREPSNKHFALANYGIDTDLVDVFEVNCDSNYIQSAGTIEAFDRWYDLAERCGRDEAAYRELCELVDVDEFLNYMATEFYIFNTDWPWNNVKGFRAQDGKFRMILMDIGDQGFAHAGGHSSPSDSPFEYFRSWQKAHYRPQLGETRIVSIFFNMMQHEAIRRQFVDTYSLVIYSVYSPEFITEVMADLVAKCEGWVNDSRIQNTLTEQWQAQALRHLVNLPEASISMEDLFTISLATNIEEGRLHLNGLPIPRQRFNGAIFAPATLTAAAPEGYRFVGWKDAEGNILSTSTDWTIAEGNRVKWGSVTASFSKIEEQDNVPPVRINEVSAANDMYVNELWDRKDWVELYNTTDQPVDVAGMYLSDNAAKPTKWRIPAASTGGMAGALTANTIIPAHGTLVIWCDKEPAGQQLHASFKLSNTDGCVVTLQAADASWTDRLDYNIHGGRESVGRYPDGGEHVYLFGRPSIDAPNHYGYFGFKSILPASIGQVARLIDSALKGEASLSDIEELVGRLLRGE